MARKTASVTLEGEGLRLTGRTGSGHALVLDTSEGDTGMRPAELVPLALAGCTAMDVASILRKKRQDIRRYEVQATGIQEDEHPNAFTRIEVLHVVEGRGVEVEAVRRAIELSATKYCSVGATLSSGRVAIHHAYVVRDLDADAEAAGEVLVLGPWATVAEAPEAATPALVIAG
ncbi:MAG TPA: OsmC family protein [Candidatus Limnocylindrales bacterium]|nr:OsmC family protein [Candidatus Limnocylindrales bacterium]